MSRKGRPRPSAPTRRPAEADRAAPCPTAQTSLSKKTTALLLATFATVFVALQVHGFRQKSGTFDEPVHLAAGLAALRDGDHRVDPTHPPFVRMWAAIPIWWSGAKLDLSPVDRAAPAEWPQQTTGFARRFLYRDNDADSLLTAGRSMILLWGVALGILIYCWTREWLGPRPAVVALALYTVAPSLSAHGQLVTTDLAAACFVFGSIYFLWRATRQYTACNAGGFITFSVLALVTKFSGIVVLPIALLLLTVSIVRTTAITGKRAGALALALGVSSYLGIWAIYGFRYAPGPTENWLFRFGDTAMVREHGGLIATSMIWLDSQRLLPNAFAQGFALTLASAAGLPGFLAGHYGTGWWYYFPVALLIKTPISMLLLAAAGLWAILRRRDTMGAAFLLLPALVILGAAMTSPINIGVRHVLGVFPFMILVGAAMVRTLFDAGVAGRAAVAVACLAAVIEFTTVYPHNLGFFNALVGGPRNGSRYLVDSNVDWGQDLKLLKRWMDASGIEHVNIAYFGTADPAYYGITCTRLPGAGLFDQDKVARPELPGYVAISETVLSGVYLPPRWRLHYRPLAGMRPVARIGNSMRVYWLDRWPDIPQSTLETLADFDALRRLADSLMRHRWYTRAAASYTRYLARRPDNADALGNLGVALVALGRKDEALDAFRRAAAAAPADPRAQSNLTLALLDAGLVTDALASAKRFVALSPSDPGAQHLLGRALAAQRDQLPSARASVETPRQPETDFPI